MYERHFGITGPPFQLSPDPAFYFDSPQHRAALAALRQAFALDAPFIALSGEVGAGKTTVLRAWIAEVQVDGVAVAQLTNTQLDADDLLRAVATAFGISTAAGTTAQALAGLRSFLRGLAGRRALLLIDEAQNLDRPALQCLVSLADMAAAEKAPLRVCLAGQPELRQHLADPTWPELQARLQPPSHLSPLDAAQTRHYIEHRMRKVGWAGKPSFDDAAFAEIHAVTGGLPRRINVLCSRLMLAQFLSDTSRIDRRAVVSAAHALHAEIGEGTVTPEPPPAAPLASKAPAIPPGALWLLASGRSDCIKAIPLLHAICARSDLPPALVVSFTKGGDWHHNHDLQSLLGVAQQQVVLVDDAASTPAQVEESFKGVMAQHRPRAVVVFDGDTVSQTCAEVAHRHQVPVVQVGADAQSTDEAANPASPRAAISELADLRFNCRAQDVATTAKPGSVAAGNILVDALYFALQAATRYEAHAERRFPPPEFLNGERGYGVVAMKQPPVGTEWPRSREILASLRQVSRDLPLVWPMCPATILALRSSGLARQLQGERIACLDELRYVSFVRLLRHATCVLTDSLDVVEEAAALGVHCLTFGPRHASHVDSGGWLPGIDVGYDSTHASRAVWNVVFNGTQRRAAPLLWDGQAGARMAAHLASWLATRTARALRTARSSQLPPGMNGVRPPGET